MSLKKFNIKPILDKSKIEYNPVGNQEIQMTCLVCGKPEHLYFNTVKNLCVCHRCKWESNAYGMLLQLGYTKKEALEAIKGKINRSIHGLKSRVRRLNSESFDTEDNEPIIYFKNIIPEGCIPVSKDHFPKALFERKVSVNMAEILGAKICNTRGKYYNRIIFPVECLKTRTFVAQTGFTKSKTKKIKKIYKERGTLFRKVMFPDGSFMGEVLYLYNKLRNTKKDVFVVEGVMDALRLLRFGLCAVAVFGSKIGETQSYLLSLMKTRNIYIMLDGDVKKEKLVKYVKRVVRDCPDKRIKVCELDKDKDPDDLSDDELFIVIKEAKTHLHYILGRK
jgi:5S rRNA maturation endonuclease (ribonuclease M5)